MPNHDFDPMSPTTEFAVVRGACGGWRLVLLRAAVRLFEWCGYDVALYVTLKDGDPTPTWSFEETP